MHQLPFCGAELAVPARSATAAIGLLLSDGGTVAAVLAAVTQQLTADRAAMPAQEPGDLGIREVLLPKDSEGISLCWGDLVITHRRSLLGGRFVSVPDRSFSREHVLHLLREFAPSNLR